MKLFIRPAGRGRRIWLSRVHSLTGGLRLSRSPYTARGHSGV